MSYTPHGRFELKRTGNVIHTYPIGGFNELGIIQIRESILKESAALDQWILYEHPANQAGLTPEALQELIESFVIFQQDGCFAIAMEVESTWAWAIQKAIPEDLTIPVFFNEDRQVVEQWIEQLNMQGG